MNRYRSIFKLACVFAKLAAKADWKMQIDNLISLIQHPEPANQELLSQQSAGNHLVDMLQSWLTAGSTLDLADLTEILEGIVKRSKPGSQLHNQATKTFKDAWIAHNAPQDVASGQPTEQSPAKPATQQARRYPTIPPAVQQALKDLNILGADGKPLNTDGKLGPNTQRALNEFQRLHGIAAGTYDDQNLWSLVIQTAKAPAESQSSEPTQLAVPTNPIATTGVGTT